MDGSNDTEISPNDRSREKRGQLIPHLEDALVLADEIEDGQNGFLIERESRPLSERSGHPGAQGLEGLGRE